MSRGTTSKDKVRAELREGDRTVDELVRLTGCTLTNVKAALLLLRDAGEAESYRAGRNEVRYRLIETRSTLALLDVPWIAKNLKRRGSTCKA